MSKSAFKEYFAVVDLETIGRFSNAVILSCGITVSRYTDKDISFNKLCDTGLYRKFDVREQISRGRTKDQSTVDWWMKQDPEAKKVLYPSPEDISIYSFPDVMEKYFRDLGINMKRDMDIYDRKCFDLNKLQYLFEVDAGRSEVPWNYQDEYELATAMRFLGWDRYGGLKVSDIPGATYHNALHDAAVDHLRLLKVLHHVE